MTLSHDDQNWFKQNQNKNTQLIDRILLTKTYHIHNFDNRGHDMFDHKGLYA